MARIAGINIPPQQHAEIGLTAIYGIGRSRAREILTNCGIEFSKKVKDPERFDIVIFKYPDDESQLFIKRLIGLPGETVEIRDGKVYINGSDEPLDDSFVPEVPTGNYGPYKVPENSYFMLGDNREYSRDSRFWKNTFVSFDEIVGKAVVRYYPSIKLLN